jgi:Ammonium Transporter Family
MAAIDLAQTGVLGFRCRGNLYSKRQHKTTWPAAPVPPRDFCALLMSSLYMYANASQSSARCTAQLGAGTGAWHLGKIQCKLNCKLARPEWKHGRKAAKCHLSRASAEPATSAATPTCPSGLSRQWASQDWLACARKGSVGVAVLCAAHLLFTSYASASVAAAVVDKGVGLLACTMAAWLMVPGLAMFHGGLVRAGSVNSILLYHVGTWALASFFWVVFGHSLVYSTEGMVEGYVGLSAVIGGWSNAFLAKLGVSSAATLQVRPCGTARGHVFVTSSSSSCP